MKARSLLLLLIVCWSCRPIEDYAVNSTDLFKGRWKLLSIEQQDTSTGDWFVPARYTGRNGFLIYDGIGGMGVHHVPESYDKYKIEGKLPLDSLTENDTRHIAQSFVYFGTYKVDNDSKIIRHYVESHILPTSWSTLAERKYQFSGDTLFLQPTSRKIPIRITWLRMNDQQIDD